LREKTEEERLFEINDSIRNLLEGLKTNEQKLMESKDENKT